MKVLADCKYWVLGVILNPCPAERARIIFFDPLNNRAHFDQATQVAKRLVKYLNPEANARALALSPEWPTVSYLVLTKSGPHKRVYLQVPRLESSSYHLSGFYASYFLKEAMGEFLTPNIPTVRFFRPAPDVCICAT
jgi:hypothetical protein